VKRYVFSHLIAVLLTLPAGSQGIPRPAAPSDLDARLAPGTRIEISWKDNSSNEDGFEIERRTIYAGESDSFRTLYKTGKNETRYTHPVPIKQGETQYFRIRAFNGSGDSEWSNVAVFRH
jgi:hypothetical protein